MSFKDLEKRNTAPHHDTPEQAKARAEAAAAAKAKHDAKAARHASHREGREDDQAKRGSPPDKGGGATRS